LCDREQLVARTTKAEAAPTVAGTSWSACPAVSKNDCVKTFTSGGDTLSCMSQMPFQGSLMLHRDGTVEIVDRDSMPYCGLSHWVQVGGRVTFDCNQVSTFDVRISGEEMKGETTLHMALPAMVSNRGAACFRRMAEPLSPEFTPPNLAGTRWRNCGLAGPPTPLTVTLNPEGAATFENGWSGDRSPHDCGTASGWTQEQERVILNCGPRSYDLRLREQGFRLIGSVADVSRKTHGLACFEIVP
jgi:hypothetical protein